jgi:hypothetical protein
VDEKVASLSSTVLLAYTYVSDSASYTTEILSSYFGIDLPLMLHPVLPSEDLYNMVTRFDQILSASSSHARCDANDSPRVDDLGKPRPEAVLLSTVLLEFKVFVGVFFRIPFSLVLLVLSVAC